MQIVNVDKPGFDTANYGVRADLMRYADNWETVPMSENDLAAYLKKTSHSERLKALGIEADIEFCLQTDLTTAIPILEGDKLVKLI